MGTDEIAHAKSALREQARAARRAVSGRRRAEAAEAIAERALALAELANVRAVASYGASAEEADPSAIERELRARGVRIAYPRVAGPRRLTLHWVDDPADLAPGAFGVLEPHAEAPLAPPDAIEAAIVPGVAFDEAGRRIGFGKGYYDALLAEWGDRVFTIGVAYDEQVVDACPAEAHDRGVSVIVTPTRTIRCATTTP